MPEAQTVRAQTPNDSDSLGHHDWYSPAYVSEWIRADEQRVRNLEVVVDRLDVRTSAPTVLDVGGGYGRLTRLVLERFPTAHVVLHDFSPPMIEQASANLAPFGSRLSVVRADLRDPDWVRAVEGPFDVVVSAIAIHNVRTPATVARVYKDICGLLSDGGQFVNLDRLEVGNEAEQRTWLLDAGFDPASVRVERINEVQLLLVARSPDERSRTA
jgi:SAM-dependent methyltransferase